MELPQEKEEEKGLKTDIAKIQNKGGVIRCGVDDNRSVGRSWWARGLEMLGRPQTPFFACGGPNRLRREKKKERKAKGKEKK